MKSSDINLFPTPAASYHDDIPYVSPCCLRQPDDGVMLYGAQVGTLAPLVTVWTLATTALILRLAARRIMELPLWLDDFSCLAAYIFGMASNVWAVVWIRDGFGLRLEHIPWLSRADAISRARRAFYFCEAFNSLSIGSSKLAILAFYWRLFSLTRVRYAIMYLAFLSLCWLVARTTASVVRCIPIAAYWDTSIHGECLVDELKLIYGGSVSHLILDSLILILPLFELHKLHLKFWPGLAVLAMFMFGILICICAIAVLVSALHLPSNDEVSFNMKNTALFAHVEVNLSIVASCLPLLRPVFKSICKNCQPSTWRSYSCTHAAGSSPPASRCGADPEQQQQQQQQQTVHNRHHRPHHPPSLSTIWSRLSKAAANKTKTRVGERAKKVGGKTVMTVVRHDGSPGAHVQLRRDLRFISPPAAPAPAVHPRMAGGLGEPSTIADVWPEGEEVILDQDNAIDRKEEFKGKALEEARDLIQSVTEGVTTDEGGPWNQVEKGKAIEEFSNLITESEDVAGKKTAVESEDEH